MHAESAPGRSPSDAFPTGAGLFDIVTLRSIEARAAQRLGDAAELMRRAGQAAWRTLLEHWPDLQRIAVVCGPGNNGGDGYELARQALGAGRDVVVVRLDMHAPRSELAIGAAERYRADGGRVLVFESALPACDLVVDALFGIGLARAPEGQAVGLIAAINAAAVPVLALDVPSGVDAASGAVLGVAVVADRTLEFIAAKAGLATGAALDHVGERSLADLDLTAADREGRPPVAGLLKADDLACWLRPRRRDSHKGGNGRVLCVGGDLGHGGAILLAAEAALRSGAGLVDIVTRPAHVAAALARRPEAMVHGVDAVAEGLLEPLLEKADVLAIGPGLGLDEWGRKLFGTARGARRAVLDADALNLLAQGAPAPDAGVVLTPHPGEAARLLGRSAAEVQADRLGAARTLATRFGCAIVLKGAGTVIAAPDGRLRVLAAGNPGMAVGGMGDVLCGVVAALLAQGLDAFDAACCGALLHSAAADAAAAGAGERGLLPSDLMPWLRRLGNPLHRFPPTSPEAARDE
ncbi:NAD(P)H-hydrate dehydratase [Marilutibacter chinensis]|uniref:Bifunctional NAD(P)H-hydrate repair enzyme n=1 Tax=Marilutibacter chinensis TaxID=2912247 RepID=A0ABS9HRZ3_9GAMM|nr:NAD(P)H-hydrate dehydratase [Lysobacter chinensis]MCF7220910.1 NAD(P)H-hydrate dehydratase [Lysobacter chinensis]